jgi:surface polysaccharide O-acyltransferase-like enzyme
MSKSARLLGVDLLKGLAAYGVVVIHSLGRQPRTAATESFVTLFLGFSVPYFLAVSLFLTCGKLLVTGPRGFLRGRVERLIIPYLVWTAIFVLVRSALYAAAGRADDLRSLWGSPLPLLFLGVASAQLYFIPLLFVGEVLAVGLVSALGDRLRRPMVVVPLAAAGLAVGWLDTLRRSPALKDPSLSPWARLALNEASYAVWCVPYLTFALLFQLGPVRRRLETLPTGLVPLLAAAAVALDVAGLVPGVERFLPYTARELLVAFGALGFAVAASRFVAPRAWVESLSACAYGIYLVHPLVIEAFEQAIARAGSLRSLVVTPPAIATFAAACFLISWWLVAQTIRVPALARWLYGVKPRR